jgi:PAS domain S-box-containing protein
VKKEKGTPKDAELRRRAEERLTGKKRETVHLPAEADAKRMVHELQVHQIELELQNEELIQAREELEKQLEKYADLYNFAPVGYFTLDEHGTILQGNLTGAKLLGIDRSRMTGRRFGSFLSDQSSTGFDAFLGKVCDGTAAETCEVALRGDRPRYLQIQGTAEESGEGKARQCRMAAMDITERKASEEILRRYELLSQHSRDIVLFIRRDDGKILEANVAATKAYGYSRDELLKLTINNLRASETLGLTAGQMAQADGQGILFETVHCRKDGSTFPVEVSSQGATIDGTRMLISVVRDITQRSQMERALRVETEQRQGAEKELQQAQKIEAVGMLAGGIAHDFNNILAAIIGFAELAKDETPEGSKARGHMERVFTAGIRGRDLVKQILTFSRQAEQEKRPLQLATLVKETLKLLRSSLPSTPSTVDIRTKLQSESGFVLADSTQMQQVIINLCTNAAYAMRGTGGKISIDLSGYNLSSPKDAPDPTMSPGPYVRLSVTDTGDGMSPDVLERIFDPFFTTKPQGERDGAWPVRCSRYRCEPRRRDYSVKPAGQGFVLYRLSSEAPGGRTSRLHGRGWRNSSGAREDTLYRR